MKKTLSILRRYRVLQGISLDELAKETKINQSWLSKIERGLVNPTLLQRKVLAEFYDVEPERLFPNS